MMHKISLKVNEESLLGLWIIFITSIVCKLVPSYVLLTFWSFKKEFQFEKLNKINYELKMIYTLFRI